MESGVIDMRTSTHRSEGREADVAFTIESWARSHDRFLDVMYDKLGIAKALQGEMWSIACDRFAQLVNGEPIDPLHVITERARCSVAAGLLYCSITEFGIRPRAGTATLLRLPTRGVAGCVHLGVNSLA